MKYQSWIWDENWYSGITFRYIARWYGAPLQAQRLLPIIMQRSMRSCKMVVGGMFVPSFEGFAAVNVTTY